MTAFKLEFEIPMYDPYEPVVVDSRVTYDGSKWISSNHTRLVTVTVRADSQDEALEIFSASWPTVRNVRKVWRSFT